MELSFIIIDDTELDHFIARKVIANANSAFYIKNFLDASQALEHVMDYDPDIKSVLVFLDIHMPLMDGFQFIEEFEKLEQAIQDKYYIVALTSSTEISDINRINSYKSFKKKITKPITAEGFTTVLNNAAKELGISL